MRGLARWLLAEAGATVGALCVGLHMVTAIAPGHGDRPTRVVLLVMAAGCVPCVRGLWLAPTARVWAMTGLMYAAMLTVHLLLLAPWTTVAGGHVHQTALSWTELGMWVGLALAALQVLLVVVVLAGRLAAAVPAVVLRAGSPPALDVDHSGLA